MANEDALVVLRRLKKATVVITNDLSYMLKNIKQFSIAIDHPPEYEGRHDEHKLKMIATQETVVRLTELVMEMRKEMIAIGASYEEEASESVHQESAATEDRRYLRF